MRALRFALVLVVAFVALSSQTNAQEGPAGDFGPIPLPPLCNVGGAGAGVVTGPGKWSDRDIYLIPLRMAAAHRDAISVSWSYQLSGPTSYDASGSGGTQNGQWGMVIEHANLAPGAYELVWEIRIMLRGGQECRRSDSVGVVVTEPPRQREGQD
jgi:hypothetical protein